MTAKLKLINKAQIKKLAKQINPEKRVGDSYLIILEYHIEKALRKSLEVHNGGKKTIDEQVAFYIGLNK